MLLCEIMVLLNKRLKFHESFNNSVLKAAVLVRGALIELKNDANDQILAVFERQVARKSDNSV